ncbi:MAG TPA: thiolase domain-containing protein [Candidatus Diapherotrites archaeon]|uniref:Thiolase domain-containing protein n=2 Tax=Candidatus Iainarchaeum sp. TaxID=3101447 RepID=A0A7J4KS88_9ARCH|nr:thiolase domain-containing protein [Candidatus Diapherotrites archaeon]
MKIGVIGTGITKFGELWDKSLRDLLAEAQLKSIEDSKISPKDIEMIFTGNMCADALSGQLHIGAMASENLRINVPSTRIESACASGAVALRQGLQAIESGAAKIVQVNGVEKMTDVSTEQVTTALMGAGDEEVEGFQGATFPALYALMARAYMHEFGLTREQLSAVSVKSHKHGSMNPIAQFQKEITVDDVANSAMVSDPLTLLDCSPITDGAASIILASESVAKKLNPEAVWIAGSQQATDTLALSARDSLTEIKATRIAADSAFKQAGISAKDVHLAEVHDCFSIAELLAIEGLGLAKKGEAGKHAAAGYHYFDSKIPINTCGGLKSCGHPIGATGVKQAVEVVHQLQQKAGKRQVKKAEVGVTQNVGGTGATVVVNVFKR